jgi:hypothetical protein
VCASYSALASLVATKDRSRFSAPLFSAPNASIITGLVSGGQVNFGDAPILRRGEYGDDDDDGLPNGFEITTIP